MSNLTLRGLLRTAHTHTHTETHEHKEHTQSHTMPMGLPLRVRETLILPSACKVWTNLWLGVVEFIEIARKDQINQQLRRN